MIMGLDMRNYASKHVKPDHVRDAPIQTRIVSVFEDERYGRPVLELETGSQFTLNDGNNNTLIKAFGYDSNNWLGQEIILEIASYKDWRSDPPVDKETVRARAVARTNVAHQAAPSGAPLPPSQPLPPSRVTPPRKDDLNDEIPF
jgi:hypothetical protein